MTAVIVTVDDAHRAELDAVAESLRRHGLQVEQVLAEVGLVAGQLPAGRALGELRVEGVAAVEEARTVRLPRRTPPCSDGRVTPPGCARRRRRARSERVVPPLDPGSEPSSGMYRVVHEDAGPVLHLLGDVDEPLVRRMRAEGLDERAVVAVQVASVGYIDSTGLSLLVRWAQSAARHGRPAVLRSASPRSGLQSAGVAHPGPQEVGDRGPTAVDRAAGTGGGRGGDRP